MYINMCICGIVSLISISFMHLEKIWGWYEKVRKQFIFGIILLFWPVYEHLPVLNFLLQFIHIYVYIYMNKLL